MSFLIVYFSEQIKWCISKIQYLSFKKGPVLFKKRSVGNLSLILLNNLTIYLSNGKLSSSVDGLSRRIEYKSTSIKTNNVKPFAHR